MWWVESLQKDSRLEMTVAAIPQEHIYYAICCLSAQQEESLAGKQAMARWIIWAGHIWP